METKEQLIKKTEDLLKYKEEMKHLYAMSSGRRLYIDGNGIFIVEIKGNTVYRGNIALIAVEYFFNS